MAQRYEVVSKGGVSSITPPLAVVYLEGNFPAGGPPEPATIIQKDFRFDPAILPIEKGTRVFFPNFDNEYHSVFSYSKPKRFDLGRYPPDADPIPSQVFDKPGTVTLRCDIHEHMRAIILILETPYFTLSSPEGGFEFKNVPAGSYTLKVWLDSATTLSRPIEVTEGADLNLDLR